MASAEPMIYLVRVPALASWSVGLGFVAFFQSSLIAGMVGDLMLTPSAFSTLYCSGLYTPAAWPARPRTWEPLGVPLCGLILGSIVQLYWSPG